MPRPDTVPGAVPGTTSPGTPGQDLPSVSSRASNGSRRLMRRSTEASSPCRGEGGTARTGQAAWATQYRATDGNSARCILPRHSAPTTRRSSARSAVSTSARPGVPRATRLWSGTPGPASPEGRAESGEQPLARLLPKVGRRRREQRPPVGELTARRFPGQYGQQLGAATTGLVGGPVQSRQAAQRTTYSGNDAPPLGIAHRSITLGVYAHGYPSPIEVPGAAADRSVGNCLTSGTRFTTLF